MHCHWGTEDALWKWLIHMAVKLASATGWESTGLWAGGLSSCLHGPIHRLLEFTQERWIKCKGYCPKKTRETLHGLFKAIIIRPAVSPLPQSIGQGGRKGPPRFKGRGRRPHHSVEWASRSHYKRTYGLEISWQPSLENIVCCKNNSLY